MDLESLKTIMPCITLHGAVCGRDRAARSNDGNRRDGHRSHAPLTDCFEQGDDRRHRHVERIRLAGHRNDHARVRLF